MLQRFLNALLPVRDQLADTWAAFRNRQEVADPAVPMVLTVAALGLLLCVFLVLSPIRLLIIGSLIVPLLALLHRRPPEWIARPPDTRMIPRETTVGSSPTQPAAQTLSAQGPPVLDPHVLPRLTGYDRDTVVEIAALTRSELLLRLDELQGAMVGPDLERTRLAAHALCGIAANVGGVALTERARQMEDAARLGYAEDCHALLPLISRDVGRLGTALMHAHRLPLPKGKSPSLEHTG